MPEDKVIIDDVIALLPQDQQGIVKLAITLNNSLVAQEQVQKKFQACMCMLKETLTYIAEESMLNNFNWKDFVVKYLKDSSFIKSDSWLNITERYFNLVKKVNIPESLAMTVLQPVIDKLIDNYKVEYPLEYAKITGVKDASESEEESDDDDKPF